MKKLQVTIIRNVPKTLQYLTRIIDFSETVRYLAWLQ